MTEPRHRGDAAMTRAAEAEYAFSLTVPPGQDLYLQILRDE